MCMLQYWDHNIAIQVDSIYKLDSLGVVSRQLPVYVE